MQKRKPGKQRWRGAVPPSEAETRNGRNAFGAAMASRIQSLASEAGLFPLFVGPRTLGAATVPRCYLFFDDVSRLRGEENLACIDGSASNTRLIIRPFGRGENRVMLLASKWNGLFQTSDLPDWRHMQILSDRDWTLALQVLVEIKAGYEEIFEVS